MALFASTIVAIPRVWIALPNYPDLWYLAHTATSLLVGPPQLARRRAGEKLNSFLRLELGLRRPPTPTTIPTTLKNLLTSPRAAHTVLKRKCCPPKRGRQQPSLWIHCQNFVNMSLSTFLMPKLICLPTSLWRSTGNKSNSSATQCIRGRCKVREKRS